jgi:hypothetical protein
MQHPDLHSPKHTPPSRNEHHFIVYGRRVTYMTRTNKGTSRVVRPLTSRVRFLVFWCCSSGASRTRLLFVQLRWRCRGPHCTAAIGIRLAVPILGVSAWLGFSGVRSARTIWRDGTKTSASHGARPAWPSARREFFPPRTATPERRELAPNALVTTERLPIPRARQLEATSPSDRAHSGFSQNLNCCYIFRRFGLIYAHDV